MSEFEKISIYVPDSLRWALDKDAELFEVFKRDGATVNRNRFLSLILLGYFDTYTAERSHLANVVEKELIDAIADPTLRESIVDNITHEITSPIPFRQRGMNFVRLSLKPTKDTEGLIRVIIDTLGKNDTVSRYLYSMLDSYSSKPSNERERIVFRKSVELIREACQSGRVVTFTTPWNKEFLHKVVPYKLVTGLDEQLNYLLCYEESNEIGNALAYRLSRINGLRILATRSIIPKTVMRHLKSMEKYGPQYAINDDEEACVRLSERGSIIYRRIYFGRPKYDRIEKIDEGELLYFSCSKDQLYLYFRRFGAGEAEVISPASLRNRIIEFHQGALQMYN